MEIFAAAIVLVTEVIKLRAEWWASLTPETQQRLAEKYAEGELQWLEFLDSLKPKP